MGKVKGRIITLILSFLIWILGYGLIILGSIYGYIIEISGAILCCICLFRMIDLTKGKSARIVVKLAVTLFYLGDIGINLFMFVRMLRS